MVGPQTHALEHHRSHQLVVQLGHRAFQPAEHPGELPEGLDAPAEQHLGLPELLEHQVSNEPLAVLGGPLGLALPEHLEEQATGHRAEVGDVVAPTEERVVLSVELLVGAVEVIKTLFHGLYNRRGHERRAVCGKPVLAAQTLDDLEPALGVAPLVVLAHRPSQELTNSGAGEVEGVLPVAAVVGVGVGSSDGVHVAIRDSRPSDGRKSQEFRKVNATIVGRRELVAVPLKRVQVGADAQACSTVASITLVPIVKSNKQSATDNQPAPGAHGVSIATLAPIHTRKVAERIRCTATLGETCSVRVVGPEASGCPGCCGSPCRQG